MRCSTADKHQEARNSKHCKPHEEGTSLPSLVRCQTSTNGAETRNNVDWDCHQLGCVRRIAEFLDDCGKKQRDGVQRSKEADSGEHHDPDLPVSERMNDILEMKIIGEATIFGHSSLDFSSLFGCQEFGTATC